MNEAVASTTSTALGQSNRLDLDKLPGPAAPMPFGWMRNALRFGRDPLSYIDQLATGGYGDVVAFSREGRRGIVLPGDRAPGALFVFGADFHRQIMVHDEVFEGGILMTAKEGGRTTQIFSALPWMTGAKHFAQRRIVYPMYHQRRVKKYHDTSVHTIERMLDRWKVDEPTQIMQESVRMLCDFEEDMILGMTPNDGPLAHVGDRTIPFFDAYVNPMAHIPLDLPFTPRRRMLTWADRVWDGFDQVVRAKQAAGAQGDDACSMLIQARYEDGSAMTHDEIVAETIHLFFAGWFTTRGPMGWIAFLLAMHPEVHANLYDELQGKLHGDPPTVEQLKDLPLLDAVVKEALRLFPPIFFIVRCPLEPVQLGNYHVPTGTECWMSIYHTHRDPEMFPEPNRFKPERWETVQPGPYAYMPYGIGVRSCAGVALANMQLRMMFAMLVQRYRLEVPDGAKVDRNGLFLLLPRSHKDDISLIVRKQDRCFAKSRKEVRGNVHGMLDLGR